MCISIQSTDMITTRSIVTDYFNYRLRNQMITNNRLLSLIRRIADCETIYRSQNAIFRFNLSSSSALIHAKTIHREVRVELFNDGQITTARIMSFIVFSAILAETIIQQQPQNEDLIIESFIDWTTEFIDIDLHLWLENRHYWVKYFEIN